MLKQAAEGLKSLTDWTIITSAKVLGSRGEICKRFVGRLILLSQVEAGLAQSPSPVQYQETPLVIQYVTKSVQ